MTKKERKNLYSQIAIALNNGKNKRAYDLVANIASEEGLFILSEYKGDAAAPALLEALEEYMRANKALTACSYDDPIKLRAARDDFFDAEKDANEAIAAARGTV